MALRPGDCPFAIIPWSQVGYHSHHKIHGLMSLRPGDRNPLVWGIGGRSWACPWFWVISRLSPFQPLLSQTVPLDEPDARLSTTRPCNTYSASNASGSSGYLLFLPHGLTFAQDLANILPVSVEGVGKGHCPQTTTWQ